MSSRVTLRTPQTGTETGTAAFVETSVMALESSQELLAMEIFPGISVDPDVRYGKPCITGTRMDVATVVGLFAAGETVETISSEYQLSVEQIRAALGFAAHVAAHLPPAVRQAS